MEPRPTQAIEHGRAARRSGFSLVEILIALVIATVGLCGFASAILSTVRLSEASRSRMVAYEAAQQMLETLRAEDVSTVFAAYNADAADGVASPGPEFEIAVAPSEGGGKLVGRIQFPTADGAPGALREDVIDSELGMPRDLDGDGNVDGNDHAGDYAVLPVRITVSGSSGSVTLCALLGDG